MSFLSRLWRFVRRPTGFVGKDLEGNHYYEYPASINDPRRTRRVVKYRGKSDMYDIAVGARQIAVQWKSWLSHTRSHPPTLNELRLDMDRQIQLAQRVASIEARDREERLRIASRKQNELEVSDAAIEAPRMREVGMRAASKENPPKTPVLDKMPTHAAMPNANADQPEAWTPRSSSRGS